MILFFFIASVCLIRYAIFNEVWRLVTDGVLNVRDIDAVMSDGLGMRYAFLGPLETAHLNAEGFTNYCERYNKSIYDVSDMTLAVIFQLVYSYIRMEMFISLFNFPCVALNEFI